MTQTDINGIQKFCGYKGVLTGEQAESNSQTVLSKAQTCGRRARPLQVRQQVAAPHHLHRHVAVQPVADEDGHREHRDHARRQPVQINLMIQLRNLFIVTFTVSKVRGHLTIRFTITLKTIKYKT